MQPGEAAQGDLVRDFAAGLVAGAGGPVRHLTTHLSHVFLAGEYAYKLKRAVKLPFVDFSGLAERRAACEAELEINRRFAPGLYLGLSEIFRTKNGFSLAGAGPPADYLVRMRRFRQADQFDELARAGRLVAAMVTQLAARIAAAHAAARPVLERAAASDYPQLISGLRQTAADGIARHGLAFDAGAVLENLAGAYPACSALIEARRAAGRVRRGHGDLHLRNICLFEGIPTPFDALEFDETLGTADVLYDLAFLLMDLRRAGLRTHANLALNAYWDASGEDEAALSLLPFFAALRAGVRMAVALEAGDKAQAQIYRALALELLAPQRGVVIAIGGLSGTGKSSVACALARHLPGAFGARVLRSDVLRKQRLGIAPSERAGAGHYRPEAREEVYRELIARGAAGSRAGASIILDATFSEAWAREMLAASGLSLARGCWLRLALEARLSRIAARRGDASDATPQMARTQVEPDLLQPPWRIYDAAEPVEQIAEAIRRDVEGLAG